MQVLVAAVQFTSEMGNLFGKSSIFPSSPYSEHSKENSLF